MEIKELEKRIDRCEKIAEIQLKKAVELSEALIQLQELNKRLIEIEINVKQIDHDSIRQMKLLFAQTQKTVAQLVDKINKGIYR